MNTDIFGGGEMVGETIAEVAGAASGGFSLLWPLAIFQGLSGLKQAQEIRDSSELTSQLNEINAKNALSDAYDAEVFGESEIAKYDPTVTGTIGDQRVGLAAQNVDVNFGTAAEIQSETKLVGFLNKLDIQNRARERAMGFKREAANIRAGISVNRSQAEINARTTAASSLIGASATGYRAYTQSSPDGLSRDTLGKSNKTGY